MANISIQPELASVDVDHSMHAFISYRAIVAGLLIAMGAMVGLLGLGLAFGGMGLGEETTARSAGLFGGIWFTASVLISLFTGSYFAARVSRFRMGRIGSVQGLVIASLFLGILSYQAIFALGTAGTFINNLIEKSGGVALELTPRESFFSTINSITENELSDFKLKSPPSVVAQGLGFRFLRGDIEGATKYLSWETGLTPTQVETKIMEINNLVNQYVTQARAQAASALRTSGWTLFLMVILGALAAVGGGALGSVANFRRPLLKEIEGRYPPAKPA